MPQFIRVTWPTPSPFSGFIFLPFGEIISMHPYAKFQVCNFTRFGDTFGGVPNFVRVVWPRPRPFSSFLFVVLEKLFIWIRMPCFKSVAFLVLEICLKSAKIYKGHVTHATLFFWIFICPFWRNCPCIRTPNFKSVGLHVLGIYLRVCHIL